MRPSVQAHSVRAHCHLSVYVSISVDVIEVEGPLQLFPHRASQQYGQPCYKVLAAMKQRHQILKFHQRNIQNPAANM